MKVTSASRGKICLLFDQEGKNFSPFLRALSNQGEIPVLKIKLFMGKNQL